MSPISFWLKGTSPILPPSGSFPTVLPSVLFPHLLSVIADYNLMLYTLFALTRTSNLGPLGFLCGLCLYRNCKECFFTLVSALMYSLRWYPSLYPSILLWSPSWLQMCLSLTVKGSLVIAARQILYSFLKKIHAFICKRFDCPIRI